MNSSFYNGVSGVKAQQFGIDVASKNITGINTPGFKSSTAEFSSIFHKELVNSYFNPTSDDIGLGTLSQATTVNFNKGAKVSTENRFDLAIDGDGWFGVIDATGEKFYTRAGAFNRDRDGYLVDNDGNYVTGTSAKNFIDGVAIDNPKQNIEYDTVDNQTKIHIPDSLVISPKPTSKVKFIGSLDPTKDSASITGETFRTTVFNGDGEENILEANFIKILPQTGSETLWKVKATIKDRDQNLISTNEGQILFNPRGGVISNTLTSIDNGGQNIDLNFGTPYDQNIPNSGFDGIVSLSSYSNKRGVEKDGHKRGEVLDYGVNKDGDIIARFDNGAIIPVSKVAIYNFQNEKGLEQTNPIYFKETQNSGKAKFYTDENGDFFQTSTISSSSLEMSNVNLSTALTELLVMQKAFDASAKSITTSDQLIQNAINMKK